MTYLLSPIVGKRNAVSANDVQYTLVTSVRYLVYGILVAQPEGGNANHKRANSSAVVTFLDNVRITLIPRLNQ